MSEELERYGSKNQVRMYVCGGLGSGRQTTPPPPGHCPGCPCPVTGDAYSTTGIGAWPTSHKNTLPLRSMPRDRPSGKNIMRMNTALRSRESCELVTPLGSANVENGISVQHTNAHSPAFATAPLLRCTMAVVCVRSDRREGARIGPACYHIVCVVD